MSAAMNVSNAASSMQPQFIRRAASIPADDASAAKLVTFLTTVPAALALFSLDLSRQ